MRWPVVAPSDLIDHFLGGELGSLPQKPIGLSSQCASQLNCPRQTIIEVRARRQSNNLSGPSIMDVPRWDSLRLAPNIPAKRSWDGDASPSSCLSSVPRFRERQESVHRDILEGQNHKIRRTADTSSLHIGWNTSPETKAWIVQQNAIGAGSGVEENDSVEGRRADSLDAPGTSDHNNAPQLPPLTIWSRHNDESNRPRFQQASGPSSADVGNNMGCSSTQKFRRSSLALAAEEQASPAPRPTRPAKLSIIEQNCEKCTLLKPQIRDFLSTMQKLDASFGPFGPYQEIHEHHLQQGVAHDEVPSFSKMHQFYDLLTEANDVAKHVVNIGPLHMGKVNAERQSKRIGAIETDDNLEGMKRHFLSESEDALKRKHRGSRDPRGTEYQPTHQEPFPNLRRHSSASSGASDRLPPMYFNAASHMTPDNSGFKLPSMNPPPTPDRHLPSPPTRPRASPPLYNLPSPISTFFQSSSSANVTSQPPHYPLSPAPSSSLTSGPTGATASAAVATHTAALQHEISVKSYALETLQQEHDKLLAALSRSKTRFRALEEKQAVADCEVNTLSEDRSRLLDRIAELEKEVLEVSEARDESRNAGIKEGKQYIEIVKMASRLELMAAEERKLMAVALAENGRQAMQKAEPEVGVERLPKEPSLRALEEDVHHLRTKCANYETTLKDIRREERCINDVITALGFARAGVEKSLKHALGDELQTCVEGRANVD